MNIYLDENLSEYVADALNSLNKGYFNHITVISTKVAFGKGVPDEEIIPEIGKDNGILITKDFNIRRIHAQFDLCKEFKIGIIFLKPQKGSDKHWEIIKLLINNWENIIELTENPKFPFAYEIPMRGKMKRL